ncbi:hypothetical protein [Streptomyces sp. WAC06614]|uniref:hypothetical protein n=1 Tax=Streptomyces sp. WAC06614 TaxID=2487416 RepID=UPI000F768CE6|nr:hypothetical protein [Streptomyces sp. WAC06614]RSS80941.1 hypothetical protein EF918_11955 [Streptomyces sp. WAC06614]
MATSRTAGRALAYLESTKNLAGCACGVAGVGLTLAGVAGTYWPVVVAGLYAAGALIAPPQRVDVPRFPDAAEQLAVLREDFARLREYLAEVELPQAAEGGLTELLELYAALLEPGWVADLVTADADTVHLLSRAIRQDVPDCVDTYHRARWWTRLNPGTVAPERALEQQLAALVEEAEAVVARLRQAATDEQETHRRYLDQRNQS